ncbi:MAG: hypothetical protein AVDCRST_MAG90-2787 [uncultured Microvirga sp.]|uniref:Uncharacterized protein n=1 Tax=uncultured Microvirga sp. TaxID=412392 RepID=A0A6J4MFI2_9HYPH|nr:MAG: hypothetical protein AVDCRST_MAG90-2787 [uncultured Microvirga sp.]
MRQQRSTLVLLTGVVLATSVASGAEAKGFRLRFGSSAQAAVARPGPAPASLAPTSAAGSQAARPAASAASPQTRSGGVFFIPSGRDRRAAQPGPTPNRAAPMLPPLSVAATIPSEPVAKPATVAPRQAKGFVILAGAPRGFDEVR